MSIPGKHTENGVYEFDYMRKADPTKGWEKFRKGIWNPETHQFLGRTAKSWGQLFIFYAIFYTVLAALFAICMYGWMSTLDDHEPKWKLDESRIGNNPGLGFRPIPLNFEQESLIWYESTNETSIKEWTELLDDFLELYTNNSKLPGGGKNQQICDFDMPPAPGKVCAVDTEHFGPCSPQNGYSFNKSSPCIFIKLNKIYGWQPEFYNDPNDLPAGMPQNLKDHIKSLPPIQRNQIWISCEGQDPGDRESIGPIEYMNRGFPSYYYPFTNTPGYLNPLVVVRLVRPTLHIIISVECRAWAKNIHYHGGELQREGSTHFEILID